MQNEKKFPKRRMIKLVSCNVLGVNHQENCCEVSTAVRKLRERQMHRIK